jgi:aspartate/glutamate racemase
MKNVGIIGGLGPETTSEFYLDVIFSCQKKDRTARPNIIIASVPLPYKIEEENLQFLEECLEVCDLLKEYETKKDLLFQKLRIEGFKKT